MNKKVWDIGNRKTDGRYNCGKIVGIKKIYEGLGYITERQYLSDFVEYEYLFAYVDCFTGTALAEWLHYSKLSTTKPEGVS